MYRLYFSSKHNSFITLSNLFTVLDKRLTCLSKLLLLLSKLYLYDCDHFDSAIRCQRKSPYMKSNYEPHYKRALTTVTELQKEVQAYRDVKDTLKRKFSTVYTFLKTYEARQKNMCPNPQNASDEYALRNKR